MLRFKTSETIKTNILFCAMKIKLSLYFSGLNTSHRRICRVCLKSLENSNRWIGLKENLSGEIIFFYIKTNNVIICGNKWFIPKKYRYNGMLLPA